MNELDLLKKRANKVKSILDQKIGVRQTHLNNLDTETKIFDENTYNKQLNTASIDLLNLASFQRRKNTVLHLETLIDAFAKAVYGEDYTFSFKVYDNSFTKLEPVMRKPVSVDDYMEVDLKDGSGGGLLEICSFAARLACNEIEGYQGPLFLDETFKSLSADKKIQDLIAVLQEYVKQTGKQFIFITHKADVYGAIADKILLTELFDKNTKVTEVTLKEIKNNYTFNFELNEDETDN
jgi:predicted ATPase